MDSHASSLQKHTSRSKARKTVEAWQEKRPKQSKKNSRSIARKTTEAKQEKRVRLRSRISIFKCLATKSVSNSPTNFNVPKKTTSTLLCERVEYMNQCWYFGVIYGSVAFHVCFSILKASNTLSLVCKFILKLIISLNFIVAKVWYHRS